MPDEVRRPRVSWSRKFAVALRGVRVAAQGESSFCVHLFFAAAALAALIAFNCPALEWALIVLCIGLVMTAELLNTALEQLFRGFDASTRDRIYPALDIAAGAVLVACLTAVVVGSVVFGHRLLILLGYAG